MVHFASNDGFNVFRLPVGWQYIINNANTASGTLDPTNSANYDLYVTPPSIVSPDGMDLMKIIAWCRNV